MLLISLSSFVRIFLPKSIISLYLSLLFIDLGLDQFIVKRYDGKVRNGCLGLGLFGHHAGHQEFNCVIA